MVPTYEPAELIASAEICMLTSRAAAPMARVLASTRQTRAKTTVIVKNPGFHTSSTRKVFVC